MQRYLAVSAARQRVLKLIDETLEGDEIIITKLFSLVSSTARLPSGIYFRTATC